MPGPPAPPKPAWHIRRAGACVWPPGRRWGVRKRPANARLPCASKPSLAGRPLRPGKVPNWRSPSLVGQWVKLGMCTRLMAAKMAVTSSRIIVGPRERHERHWDPPAPWERGACPLPWARHEIRLFLCRSSPLHGGSCRQSHLFLCLHLPLFTHTPGAVFPRRRAPTGHQKGQVTSGSSR